jgi:hypothetical protein
MGDAGRPPDRGGLGRDRPDLRLLRHVAAGHQHRHHHRHVPDGVRIQTSQNREATALNIKIDELISAHPEARNRLISEEVATEKEIEEDERAMMERAQDQD